MKTIIIKSNGDVPQMKKNVSKLEKYIDYNITDACVRTTFMGLENFNTVVGEMKDAVALNDFDVFLVGVVDEMSEQLDSIKNINRAHTLICDVDDYASAKNYVIML